jgi:hypothetical protein
VLSLIVFSQPYVKGSFMVSYDAFQDSEKAYENGKAFNENPYEDSRLRGLWESGWIMIL